MYNNFSTTDFALTDLLGDLKFAGLRWATILAIAFCGIDFAGLARLFTPERDGSHSLETWYLLGAWFLGATMNAMMTWWAAGRAGRFNWPRTLCLPCLRLRPAPDRRPSCLKCNAGARTLRGGQSSPQRAASIRIWRRR